MPFPVRYIRKNSGSMYARVLHAMAQFVLKMEKNVRYHRDSHLAVSVPDYGSCFHPNLFVFRRNLLGDNQTFFSKGVKVASAVLCSLINHDKISQSQSLIELFK